MKTKQIITAIVILALALAAVAYNNLRKPIVVEVPNPQAVEWPSAEKKKEIISESKSNYRINAAYPIAQGEAVTMYFKTFVENEISVFKQNIEEMGAEENRYVMTLDISYEQEKASNAHNYVFLINMDYGGAHGMQTHKTFSFTKEGKLLTLSDLFTNGVDGLKTISPYVQKELLKREYAVADWIKEGTMPSEENYRNFIVADESVIFIYDPYHVGPYSSGTQKATVPVSAFNTIANKQLFK